MEAIENILQSVSEELGGVASGQAVLGTPVQLGAMTVYPLSLVSVALGAGGGEGENARGDAGGKEQGVGGGAGGGARARPVAVLVFGPDGVKVLKLPEKRGPVERLLDKIPELVERIKERDGCKA